MRDNTVFWLPARSRFLAEKISLDKSFILFRFWDRGRVRAAFIYRCMCVCVSHCSLSLCRARCPCPAEGGDLLPHGGTAGPPVSRTCPLPAQKGPQNGPVDAGISQNPSIVALCSWLVDHRAIWVTLSSSLPDFGEGERLGYASTEHMVW